MLKSLLRPLRQKLCPPVIAGPVVQLSPSDEAIAVRCRQYTMTSPECIASLLDSVEYIVRRDLPGAFAECGVWRGGSVLAMVLKLMELGVRDRDIYLYDTFEGMTAPTDHDTSPFHAPASKDWEAAQKTGGKIYDGLFNEEIFNESLVRDVLLNSGYPAERLHFVRGPVEQTIPATMPAELALLRLDTDWYESTRHELVHMYPLLTRNGILIIDDYGHWEGAQRATDEYFSDGSALPVLLHRVDHSARLVIKP
jgi:O-methyltransferase